VSDCCLCPMKTVQEYHAHFLCNDFFSLVIDQHSELVFYSAGSLMHQSVNRQGAQNDDNNRHGCYLNQMS